MKLETTRNSQKNQRELLLQNLKEAYNEEIDLLSELVYDPRMKKLPEFMEDIIKIENLFNKRFNEKLTEQKNARKKYNNKNLVKYCAMSKPFSQFETIGDLNYAMNLNKDKFEKFINKIAATLKDKHINLCNEPKASLKDNKRTFYKSYYIYGGDIKQMSDCLRCSFVFANFDDLYNGFNVIEDVVSFAQCENGILRVKDRFSDMKTPPFGYRDLLINIYCPQTELVCELQCHHESLYAVKGISHKYYKIARLFEKDNNNEMYDIADKYIRKDVEDEIYGIPEENDEIKRNEMQNDQNNNKKHGKTEKEPLYAKLLNEWKLLQYRKIFENEGFDVVDFWDELLKNDNEILKSVIQMKQGHILIFVKEFNSYKQSAQQDIKEKKDKSDEKSSQAEEALNETPKEKKDKKGSPKRMKRHNELLKEWELSQYASKFEKEGWDDVEMWDILFEHDCHILRNMDMKTGHINKFKKKYAELKESK